MITIIGRHRTSKEIFNGGQKHLFEIVKALNNKGIQIQVITPTKNIDEKNIRLVNRIYKLSK